MKPDFTADGVRVQTFQEIYDQLAEGYRNIYGQDINLEPNSPDGQRTAIEAQERLDVQTFGLVTYQQFDPDFAFGQALERLIKLAGITRRPATRSQADVNVTTDRPVILPAGYAAEDALGQKWVTLSAVTIAGAGVTAVTLFAENFGAVEADPATITEAATFVIGVQSLTNPLAAVVGRDEETDEQLRVRRNRSLETPTSSSVGRLYTALADLTNVTDLAVYENDTDNTDARGIPAHSLWVVIEGGAVADIVEMMVFNKTGGKPLKGSVSGEFVETVARPGGGSFEIFHEMFFDRPNYSAVEVRLTATRKDAASPVDESLIAQEVASRLFVVGQNIIANDLYRDVFRAGDNFIPTDLEISRDGMTWTDERLVASPDEKFTIDAADVTVTEVIP
ncbi:baseplate J/gp47 family protein [Marinobacter sp.]|uniref:baseplate J/gp47 family protein n=1 Tax=Marinobacter sp. TaxID=50741 RepID=UPI000C910495|nr:baseplate J/gp47 family protein [Marinobacter sp.]MAB53542.1 hypothetical protein [Marinobacter sp.]